MHVINFLIDHFWDYFSSAFYIDIVKKNLSRKPKIFYEVHVHGKPLLYDIQIISMHVFK